jgi:hypothetical protein
VNEFVQPDTHEDDDLQPNAGSGEDNIDQDLAEDETADSASSAEGDSGDDDEHYVPLSQLLEVRHKLTQAQYRERELSEWKEQHEPLLLEFQGRVPEFRQAITERQQLLQEKEAWTRRAEALQAAMLRAKETGEVDFDPAQQEREQALMLGLQKLNQIDTILEQKMTGFQEQLQRQQREQAQYMESVRLHQESETKFTSELDKILEKAPELEVQRDAFMRQHQASPEASAEEIAGWAVDLATKARVTRAARKNANAKRQPKSASGPSAKPASDEPRAQDYSGMTVRQIVEAKRKELRSLD